VAEKKAQTFSPAPKLIKILSSKFARQPAWRRTRANGCGFLLFKFLPCCQVVKIEKIGKAVQSTAFPI